MLPRSGLNLPGSRVWSWTSDPLACTVPVWDYRCWTTTHLVINVFYIKHSQGLVSIQESCKVNEVILDPGWGLILITLPLLLSLLIEFIN